MWTYGAMSGGFDSVKLSFSFMGLFSPLPSLLLCCFFKGDIYHLQDKNDLIIF